MPFKEQSDVYRVRIVEFQVYFKPVHQIMLTDGTFIRAIKQLEAITKVKI